MEHGAIASHGGPEALDLFRKVMRASASIPVAFPPVLLQVQAAGRQYDEMYVDGGRVGTGVLLWVHAGPQGRRPRGWSRRDSTGPHLRHPQRPVKSTWQTVQPRLLPIAARSVSTLLYHEGVGDLSASTRSPTGRESTTNSRAYPTTSSPTPRAAVRPRGDDSPVRDGLQDGQARLPLAIASAGAGRTTARGKPAGRRN